MLVKNFFENPDVLHIGAQAPRSYYIPYSSEKAAKSAVPAERRRSERCFSLCGSWQFRFYENVRTLHDSFWEPDFPRSGFSEVTVPAVWQNYGVDRHQYTNINFPFPYDPPFVPAQNPCGAYLHDFIFSPRENRRYLLNLESLAQRHLRRLQPGAAFHQ